jgi:hypothetical protein
MTDPTYDAESHHTPESRDRDARWVGHGPKGETMTADPKCEAGCISYYGGEKKHHRDCPYYPESLTKLNADRIEAQLAERDALEAENQRLREAGRLLSLMAQTSGGTAGPDTGLIEAIDRWENAALKGDKT